MSPTLKLLAVAAVVLLILDGIWLGFVANRFYLEQLGGLARLKEDGRMDVMYGAAAVVYILLIFGVVFFALPQVAPTSSWLVAFAWGSFFGLLVYGIYDMTNLATLARWPLVMSLVDMAWGSFLCGAATVALKFVRD